MATNNKLPDDAPIKLTELPSQKIASVEHMRAIIDGVMSTENMELRTNIPRRMVPHLIRMQLFADYYNSDTMQSIVNGFQQTPVGVGGWGMGNLIKALQAAQTQPDQDQNMMRKLGKVFGMGRGV